MADSSVTIAGDLGAPASRLIDKISDAIGGIAKPWQVKRLARAEAQAEIIRAEAKIQINEIERRGLERLIREQGKNQENIERIAHIAADQMQEGDRPEDIEDDWIRHFFDRCKYTSDEQIQQIWSNILAGEARSPGSFSRRTVDILSSLDKDDAVKFNALSAFVIGLERNLVLLYDPESSAAKSRGISFKNLTHLDSIGLINFNSVTDFSLTQSSDKIHVHYGSSRISITLAGILGREFNIGKVILTESGTQLMRVCEPVYDVNVLNEFMGKWREFGLSPSLVS